MLISRTLRAPIAAAAVLVGVLLSAPAFAQAHIRGTLTDAKDGTISVQTAKGGTESIKLANDAGLFLVTKADMSAIQSGKFVGITSVEQGGKRVVYLSFRVDHLGVLFVALEDLQASLQQALEFAVA